MGGDISAALIRYITTDSWAVPLAAVLIGYITTDSKNFASQKAVVT